MINTLIITYYRRSGRIFFSRVNFVCWPLFAVRSIPMLLQRHVKDPSHSAKSAGGRLHLNRHTLPTKWSQSGLTLLSRHSVRTSQGNKLIHNLSGNTWPQLSQLAEPLWIDPGLKSGIGMMQKLISIITKKSKSSDDSHIKVQNYKNQVSLCLLLNTHQSNKAYHAWSF